MDIESDIELEARVKETLTFITDGSMSLQWYDKPKLDRQIMTVKYLMSENKRLTGIINDFNKGDVK